MAYKRMKPARPSASTPLDTGLRDAANLIDRNRFTEAKERLEALHRRFPHRTEPLQMMLNIAVKSGDSLAFDAAITRLVEMAPDKPDFALAQAANTLSNGLIGLALERFKLFVARWPDHPETAKNRETVANLEAQLTQLMDEAGLQEANRVELAARNDEVQLLITQARFKEARALIEQLLEHNPRYAPALNNLALTYLLGGQPERAIAAAERVLAFEPENVHALSNLARGHHLLGHAEEAAQGAAFMQSSTAFAAGRTGKILETLSYLGDDAGVVAFYRQAAARGEDPLLETPMPHHLAGAAALRLGQEQEAQQFWKEALKLDRDFSLTKDNLADLKLPPGQRNAPWAFSMGYWLTQEALRDFAAALEQRSKSAPTGSDPDQPIRDAVRAFLQPQPFLQTLVPVLLERGDPEGRKFAFSLAKLAQTPETLTALRDFALSQHGPDRMRIDAANVAMQAGMLERGKIRLWIRGNWQELLLMDWELHGEARGPAHSRQVERLLEQATEALYAGDGKRSEQLLKQALEIEPDAPDLLNNLANSYRLQNRMAESAELMYQIADRFPDYFFGKINIAQILLEQGRLDETTAILMPLLEQKRLHFAEFVALAQAQIELLLAKGETEAARMWYDMWKQSLPDHPALHRYRTRFEGHGRSQSRPLPNPFERG